MGVRKLESLRLLASLPGSEDVLPDFAEQLLRRERPVQRGAGSVRGQHAHSRSENFAERDGALAHCGGRFVEVEAFRYTVGEPARAGGWSEDVRGRSRRDQERTPFGERGPERRSDRASVSDDDTRYETVHHRSGRYEGSSYDDTEHPRITGREPGAAVVHTGSTHPTYGHGRSGSFDATGRNDAPCADDDQGHCAQGKHVIAGWYIERPAPSQSPEQSRPGYDVESSSSGAADAESTSDEPGDAVEDDAWNHARRSFAAAELDPRVGSTANLVEGTHECAPLDGSRYLEPTPGLVETHPFGASRSEQPWIDQQPASGQPWVEQSTPGLVEAHSFGATRSHEPRWIDQQPASSQPWVEQSTPGVVEAHPFGASRSYEPRWIDQQPASSQPRVEQPTPGLIEAHPFGASRSEQPWIDQQPAPSQPRVEQPASGQPRLHEPLAADAAGSTSASWRVTSSESVCRRTPRRHTGYRRSSTRARPAD